MRSAAVRCGGLLRVADPTRIRLHWLGTPNPAMTRATVTFRPTTAQRQWLDRQRQARGIPITTLLQLALEQAMQADPATQSLDPEQQQAK